MRILVRRSIVLALAAPMLFGLVACTSNPQEAQLKAEPTTAVSCNGTPEEDPVSQTEEVQDFLAHLVSDERDERMCAALAKNGPKVMKAITDGHLGPFTKGHLTQSTFKPSTVSGTLRVYITKDEMFQVLVELEADEVTIRRFVNIAVFDGNQWASIGINGRGLAGVILEKPNDSASRDSSTDITLRALEGKPDLDKLKKLDDRVLGVLNSWTAEPKSTTPTRFKSIV